MRAFAVPKFAEAPAIYDLPMPSADGAFLIRVRMRGSIRSTTSSSNS